MWQGWRRGRLAIEKGEPKTEIRWEESVEALTCDGGVDGLRLGRSVGEGLGACGIFGEA
jgi:hypothetical protein